MDNMRKSTSLTCHSSLDEEKVEEDIFYKELLETSLRDIAFITSIEAYKTISSTNVRACTLALEGAHEGTLVVADFQTRGKGRWNRMWFASPGNCLLFSLILRPHLSLEEANLVGLALSLAIVRSVQELGIQAAIKWPNDVMAPSLKGERKLAGILVEVGRGTAERAVDYLVAGVGLNVKGDHNVFPEDLSAVAISLEGLGVSVPSRDQLLHSIFHHFLPLYFLLQENRQKFIEAAYEKVQVGRTVRVSFRQRETEGAIIGLDTCGELVIGTAQEKLIIPVREVERVLYTSGL